MTVGNRPVPSAQNPSAAGTTPRIAWTFLPRLPLLRSLATAALAAGLAFVPLLQGCGGGTTGDPDDPEAPPASAEMTGRVSDGVDADTGTPLQVRVKGSVGLDRSGGRPAPGTTDTDYRLPLSGLPGPYLLADTNRLLYSVRVDAGVANLTPFTTLLVAELLGSDPADRFALGGQNGNGGFTGVTQAQIDAAQQRTRRFIERELGFALGDAVGDFVTTPFERVTGDPMFDAIQGLTAQLGNEGNYTGLVTQVVEESRRCAGESLRVAGTGSASAAEDRFCPFAKSYEAEEADPSVSDVRFTTRFGDALSVRVRGSDVLQASLRTVEGDTYACSGAGCSGLALGTPAGNGTRAVAFAGVTLSGPAGQRVLDGSLQSAEPGVVLPSLPCTTNRFYVIAADRTVQGRCTRTNDFLPELGGDGAPSGLTRIRYVFSAVLEDPDASQQLEVMTEGDRVVSALLYATQSGVDGFTQRFQCRDAGCAGISLGSVRVDQTFGYPTELRSIGFNDVVMRAVGPDGSLSASDTVTVRAEVVGGVQRDPSVGVLVPAACADPGNAVSVARSEGGPTLSVCEPADLMGFPPLASTIVEANGLSYTLANLLLDDFGGATSGNTVSVLFESGTVTRVSFDAQSGPSYRCEGAACSGATVSAPDGLGRTTVSFAGTLLTEVGTANVPGDRTATLNGSFVAPPP